jgi:hypothetical protein
MLYLYMELPFYIQTALIWYTDVLFYISNSYKRHVCILFNTRN